MFGTGATVVKLKIQYALCATANFPPTPEGGTTLIQIFIFPVASESTVEFGWRAFCFPG